MAHEAPGSRNRGIEHIVGAQHNKAAVLSFSEREITTISEDPAKAEYAETLPCINPFDETMRFSPEGDILISTIRPSQKTLPEDQAGSQVVRWSKSESINDARKVVGHIANAYSKNGIEHQNRIAAVKLANNLIKKFKYPVSEQELDAMHQDATETLFEAKYLTSIIPARRKTAEQFLRATMKDSLGRLNPSMGRLRVGQERDDLIKDLTLDEVKYFKNIARAARLDAERDYEESVLRGFSRRSKELLNMGIGTTLYDQKLKGYKREAHYFLSPKHTILVKPYSKAAAELRFNLFAHDFPYDVWKLGTYIGVNEAYQIAKGFIPFDELLPEAQKARIGTFPAIVEEVIAESDEERDLSREDEFWNEVDKLKI